MAKTKTQYSCAECGWTSFKWVGQCRSCNQWGTLEEAKIDNLNTSAVASSLVLPSNFVPAQPVSEIDTEKVTAISTKIDEFDRVLGRGIVPGAVILLAGEPGIGKSTLLLDVAAKLATTRSQAGPVLYITGEESVAQVRLRAERIGALSPFLLLAATNQVETVLAQIQATNPQLVIVDSAQTLTTTTAEGSAGSVSQVRSVSALLIQVAKTLQIPLLLVGHVTKDGTVAGPKTLEHLVDVVCQFEGDRHSSLRLLRAVKNRYGPTDEIGCFTMSDTGIVQVPDPSRLFLSTNTDSIGSAITVTLEGNRPLVTEIQALVSPSSAANPRRVTSGVDSSRVTMILAVLQTHLGIDLSNREVYTSTVGGAKANRPSADLPLALAIVSAAIGKPVPKDLVSFGEIGLTSDIRTCPGTSRRLQEAARLGYRMIVIPSTKDLAATAKKFSHLGVEVLPINSLSAVVKHFFQ